MALPEAARDYFKHLSAGHFAEASSCFSEDAFYSHPAYDPEAARPSRIEARGRESIQRVFELRGRRDWVHESRADTVEDRFYVEGMVRQDGVPLLSYLSVGRLDTNGLISSYVAYDARPPVGRQESPR